jgi:hypothetical protein
MKTAPIEKFQYLVHLKATNVHLFYRLLSEHIKVRVGSRALRSCSLTRPGIDTSHLHSDRRRSMPTMARDLDTA